MALPAASGLLSHSQLTLPARVPQSGAQKAMEDGGPQGGA